MPKNGITSFETPSHGDLSPLHENGRMSLHSAAKLVMNCRIGKTPIRSARTPSVPSVGIARRRDPHTPTPVPSVGIARRAIRIHDTSPSPETARAARGPYPGRDRAPRDPQTPTSVPSVGIARRAIRIHDTLLRFETARAAHGPYRGTARVFRFLTTHGANSESGCGRQLPTTRNRRNRQWPAWQVPSTSSRAPSSSRGPSARSSRKGMRSSG